MADEVDGANLFSSAVQASRLGELRWAMVPLALWAVLALSLIKAVTVAAPASSVTSVTAPSVTEAIARPSAVARTQVLLSK